MDKSNSAAGPKVSQIANIFQRKPFDDDKESKDNPGGNAVMRTESHAARFNNARALFEKLGEGRINRPAAFSIKHSTSKEDNLKDPSPERQRTPSPKKKYTAISNGVGKTDVGMIQNVSRIKMDRPEKPEKPERKFNSKELIEKQKNWTSHFSKNRPPPSAGITRCDIIRAVPGPGVINNADINKIQDNAKELKSTTRSPSFESPPSPSIRNSYNPPEIKPRTTSRSNSLTSPTKALPPIPTNKPSPDHVRSQRQPDGRSDEILEKPTRKKSLDFNEPIILHSNHSSLPPEIPTSRRYSSDKDSNSVTSPAHAINSAASSSGPSSPVHTEDEKQENESNEKTEIDANSEGKSPLLLFLCQEMEGLSELIPHDDACVSKIRS